MLQVKNVEAKYGNIRALKSISINVPKGDIVGIIGGNGAGKTTLLKVISGLMRPTNGEIWFDGVRIDTMNPANIVKMGLCHVPEGRHVFPEMTVYENLMMGGYTNKDKIALNKTLDRVYNLFPRMKERAFQTAGTLSGGEQQMLAVGRAMMAQPKMIMLDEPSMGLAPLVVEDIANAVKELNEEGVTILLVEQKAPMALRLSKEVFIMETGNVVLSGTSEELKKDDRVKKIYLGQ